MQAEFGLIGGTGVGSLLAAEGGSPIHIPTRYGTVRARRLDIGGRATILVSRHSAGHSVPPHLVNYRAMALALKQVGAKACFASAAVGALRPELQVGDLVVCSDFLDLSGRNLTLFDGNVVHTPFAQPFGPHARQALLGSAEELALPVRTEGVYLGLNGPRFETPHEVRMLQTIGDVVGMTAASEAIVMKEAGIEYGLLAVVTNLGEGLGGAVEHGLVSDVMKGVGPKAVDILKQSVTRFNLRPSQPS